MDFETKTQETTEVIEKAPTEVKESRTTVGFWEFFGLIALFAIPVVGFIACIVFMFSPKRKVMKSYARAVFAWMMTRVVLTVAVVLLVVSILGGMLLPTINSSLNTNFTSIFEVINLVGSVATDNYTKTIEILTPQLVEQMGEEYEPILIELSKKQYNEMFNQIADGEYTNLLVDFKGGRYDDLKEVLGDDTFDQLIEELELAAAGEGSEVLDEIREMLNII